MGTENGFDLLSDGEDQNRDADYSYLEEQFWNLVESFANEGIKRPVEISDLIRAACAMYALGFGPYEVKMTAYRKLVPHVLWLLEQFVEQLEENPSTREILRKMAIDRLKHELGDGTADLDEFQGLAKGDVYQAMDFNCEHEGTGKRQHELMKVSQGHLELLAVVHQAEWLYEMSRVEAYVQAAYDLLAAGYSMGMVFWVAEPAIHLQYHESIFEQFAVIDKDPNLRQCLKVSAQNRLRLALAAI
ncbi:MAG: hypothetical protein OXE17_05645 [Chloroflexi bacterium]|nr:hypothetical protein [Chloroflexota bacterium]